jgi:branched-chain amino acid transport system substrate-binding protein
VYSVLEVAIDVLKRTTDVDDKAAIVESIKATNVDTIAGTVNWTEPGPVPNVAKMKLAGGQWQTGTDYPYDLVVVSNSVFPEVETQGELQPVPGS